MESLYFERLYRYFLAIFRLAISQFLKFSAPIAPESAPIGTLLAQAKTEDSSRETLRFELVKLTESTQLKLPNMTQPSQRAKFSYGSAINR
ncbi:MAG: hypothetical protein BJG00_014100 [Limnothrix sp. CACIAM 69d]|nr:MAG: hypothetical protein BJG00_014100 [Limnothrix sp. CACIAM 69d]